MPPTAHAKPFASRLPTLSLVTRRPAVKGFLKRFNTYIAASAAWRTAFDFSIESGHEAEQPKKNPIAGGSDRVGGTA
jgi:hypothetical protein